MSRLPLASVFSAAHVSKWEVLPEDILAHAAQSRVKLGRMMGPRIDDPSNSEETGHEVQTPPEPSNLQSEPCAIRIATGSGRTESRDGMAVKTYTWVTFWFLLAAPIVLWDVTYCFMRPRSMVGGDLHWIWEPYGLYQEIDYVYGWKALEENSGFTNAQSLLNLVETALSLSYVYFAHMSDWSGAPLVGFASAVMTLSKTSLYLAQEYYCGRCAVGHNPWSTYLLLWVLPNGLWILFPSMIVWRLGTDIIESLSVASRSGRKAVSGKMQ